MYFDQGWSERRKHQLDHLAYGLTTDAILNVDNSMYPRKNVGLCTTHQTLEQKTRA